MTQRDIFRLRLYVAGGAQNSEQALVNLTAICRAAIPDQYHIEVVDVLKEPGRTFADSVFMTPTLLKLQPGPQRRIVGTLSDEQTVLRALGLAAVAA